jgi:hypothetical protein
MEDAVDLGLVALQALVDGAPARAGDEPRLEYGDVVFGVARAIDELRSVRRPKVNRLSPRT